MAKLEEKLTRLKKLTDAKGLHENKKEPNALFFYKHDIASDDRIKTRKDVKGIGKPVLAV
ncbi:hypothetical protein [Bacillus sp. GbtcB13]|uniref:hypothetical protein n=1 Tax=Bacillus sp. GbtcB13 TaxID=2824758 RepID=UPI001C3092DC|nr:hypothetical protein [Bacillus sp. GbtcB13]